MVGTTDIRVIMWRRLVIGKKWALIRTTLPINRLDSESFRMRRMWPMASRQRPATAPTALGACVLS